MLKIHEANVNEYYRHLLLLLLFLLGLLAFILEVSSFEGVCYKTEVVCCDGGFAFGTAWIVVLVIMVGLCGYQPK